MAAKKLTKDAIGKELKAAGDRVFDPGCPGMYAERGAHSISIRAKGDLWRDGKLEASRTTTLGRYDLKLEGLDLDKVRNAAQKWLGTLRGGSDPNAPASPAGGLTVGIAFERYERHLRERENPAALRTIEEFERLTKRERWGDLYDQPIIAIERSDLRALHDRVANDKKHPRPTTANKLMRAFRAAYRLAHKHADRKERAQFDEQVTASVGWKKETSRKGKVAMGEDDFPKWYAAVKALNNPLRRTMHEIGLWSGLRPGNLTSMRRDWIDFERHAIVFPREEMKARRREGNFVLPLSSRLELLIRKALAIGDTWYEGTPWVLPTRDGGHIAVVREPTLGVHWGHALRHAYRIQAVRAKVDPTTIEALLDHAVGGGGISEWYFGETSTTLWSHALESQEKISTCLLELTRKK